jgi:hypothetical protein
MKQSHRLNGPYRNATYWLFLVTMFASVLLGKLLNVGPLVLAFILTTLIPLVALKHMQLRGYMPGDKRQSIGMVIAAFAMGALLAVLILIS